MLDTKSSLILKILQKECKNNGYKIIEKNDIISALPNKYRCEYDELDNITSYLERQDYISIKYDDEMVYCLCVLPRANELNEMQQKKEKKHLPFLIFVLIFAFIGAFLGSYLSRFI